MREFCAHDDINHSRQGSVRVFVAASTRCFAELEFWQALDQIRDLEFDRVEVWLDENGALKPSKIVADPDDFIRRLREQARLSPIAFTFAHDVDSATFAAMCKVAKTLRITQFVVPASPLGTPFNLEIDRLRALVVTASADGIRIAVRTEAGRVTGDAYTAVELCQAVDRLGISFDPSYFLDPKNSDAIIEMVSPYTLHTHLRDSTLQQVQVQVGLGEIDYSGLVDQLSRQHYTRALAVEILPEKMELQHRPLEMRKLRMLLESLL
ncbi:sugar phosphate isomerase/epimerase family protein [Planctomicrobium sp. SH668]|uniref:sugar phosphate isomerase/epimerase family protein n=1 Tax=Planctomicrobium sp. SH668 TaxID=3448126 RepID=UPI003F5AEEB9